MESRRLREGVASYVVGALDTGGAELHNPLRLCVKRLIAFLDVMTDALPYVGHQCAGKSGW